MFTDRGLHQLFEDQVSKTPDAIALVWGERQLSYLELDQRANQFAHYLLAQGIQPSAYVGLQLERSVGMVVAIFGVLKAGGSLVPLDLQLPQSAVAYRVQETQMPFIITEREYCHELPESVSPVFWSEVESRIISESVVRLEEHTCINTIAYLVYTSGSTGAPKGVMISHRALVRCHLWSTQIFEFTHADRFLLNFVRAPEELFFPLFLGATLVLSPCGAERDTALLAQTIRQHEITVLGTTPSLLNVLLDEPELAQSSRLKHVYCAGEVLSGDLSKKFFKRLSADLYNAYGLAEAPFTTIWKCRPEDAQSVMPIGFPVDAEVHLLGAEGVPVVGQAVGEIYISGDGLALGYLNLPELTATSFVQIEGCLYYKTGDQGAYDCEGALILLGRSDHQVQIRGLRVELGEIEAALREFDLIRESSVTYTEDRLHAYLSCEPGVQIDTNELRAFLATRLSSHMLPSAYVILDRMPLTVTGKIDRQSLPQPERQVITDLRTQTLSATDRHKVLVEWNATAVDFGPALCVHQLFEAQVVRSPSSIAVSFQESQLSYLELNQKANQLAHYLEGQGVRPGEFISVCIERSLDMLISLIAIHKVGSAYVPVDPAYPQHRIRQILADSQSRWILTQEHLRGALPKTNAQAICVDAESDSITQHSVEHLPCVWDASELAYVMYTSGSTGVPKGVAIEQRNVTALLSWATSVYSQDDLAGVLAATSICFDLSVFELFAPLICGGTVVLFESILELSPTAPSHPITLINTVPSAIVELLHARRIPATVKIVNLAGEPLRAEVVDELYQLETIERVYDLYGPSETTTYSTVALREPQGQVTIGRPISNTLVYLLNESQQPVAIGAVGEMWIGGAGVARGYLNAPQLTAERFVNNPFAAGRMYRTGDLGRYYKGGELEYLGRSDQQVKLRGYRIELGEIETALQAYAGVSQCVIVVAESASNRPCLVAHFLASEAIDTSALSAHLRSTLPSYMVPAALNQVEQLPRTANGKIDRMALSRLPFPQSDPSLEAPILNGELESQLLALWGSVLQRDQVQLTDNFFEIGGDSLQAMQLAVAIEQQLGVKVPVASIVQSPSVAEFSHRLAHPEATPKWRALVPLKASGTKSPLFLVHGLYGDLNAFLALVRSLDSEQPVYGFQALGVDGAEPLQPTIEAMVELYFEELIRLQPEGPYTIGAYSMGGTFAYALAQRVEASGRQVKLLALMDCAPIGRLPLYVLLRTRSVFLCKKTVGYLRRWLTQSMQQKLAECRRWPSVFRFWMGSKTAHLPEIEVAATASQQQLEPSELGAYFKALVTSYSFTHYAGAVSVLLSDTHGTWQTQAWKYLVQGELRFYHVPGRHEAIIRSPHVEHLAAELTRALEDVGHGHD